MSSSSVLFHCPCLSALSVTKPPPSSPPLSTLRHHELSSLLFCEECDAVRCDTCAQQEIACYYCPNCLFEVPSASVRAEKNRCARNCFQCPQCDHSLAVVATDPAPPSAEGGSTQATAAIGETTYRLSCAVCHWDSKQVGVSFEKPTGLAAQLQKQDQSAKADSVRELAEFDRLKDHFDGFLQRSNQAPSGSAALRDNPLLSARALLASSSLAGLRSRIDRERDAGHASGRDELEPYKALRPASKVDGGIEGELSFDAGQVGRMRNMQSLDDVAEIHKRWSNGSRQSVSAADLRPLRTPLHTKRSKRCPTCTHILIKPEQKSSSTRFKIKLVASNYLPAIDVQRRAPALLGSRLSAIAASSRRQASRSTGTSTPSEDSEPLRPGRTYTFELGFTNPLYEPIHVRLAVARPQAIVGADGTSVPPFAVNLPTAYFPIAAYAEEWEYEMDDEDDDVEDGASEEGSGSSRRRKLAGKYGLGIVERKMNKTTVALEVAVAKEAVGPLRVNMLVTYYYQSDDSAAPPSPTKSPVKGGHKDDRKSFSFWTLFTLGSAVPRSERSEISSRKSMAPAGGTG